MPTTIATVAVPKDSATAAAAATTPVGQRSRLLRLSPSRAADFRTCPARYRFIAIDKVRTPRSLAALRGIVVHKVLEELLAAAPAQRTPALATALVEPAWAHIAANPALVCAEVIDPTDASAVARLLDRVHAVVDAYRTIEDPTTVNVAGREQRLYVRLNDDVALTGIADRVDNLGRDAVGLVDYKTAATPPTPAQQSAALWQLTFYAVIWWRKHAVAPRWVRLLYLGAGHTVTYSPDESELIALEATVTAIAEQITTATATGVFTATPSASACRWCDFQRICPDSVATPPTNSDTSTVEAARA